MASSSYTMPRVREGIRTHLYRENIIAWLAMYVVIEGHVPFAPWFDGGKYVATSTVIVNLGYWLCSYIAIKLFVS